jgi:hypothetical protein
MATTTTPEAVKVNVRCTRRERDRFHKACKREGTTPSDILRRLMLDYSAGNIHYPVHQEK